MENKKDLRVKIIKALEGGQEVVINASFGGFCISEAVGRILKQKGVNILFEGDKYSDGNVCDRFYGYLENEDFGIVSDNYYEYRTDKRLIEAIKEVGLKKASGKTSELKIIRIPVDIDWEIDEYDGVEKVEEKHQIWS